MVAALRNFIWKNADWFRVFASEWIYRRRGDVRGHQGGPHQVVAWPGVDPRHQVVWPPPGPPLSLLWTPSRVGKNRNFGLHLVEFVQISGSLDEFLTSRKSNPIQAETRWKVFVKVVYTTSFDIIALAHSCGTRGSTSTPPRCVVADRFQSCRMTRRGDKTHVHAWKAKSDSNTWRYARSIWRYRSSSLQTQRQQEALAHGSNSKTKSLRRVPISILESLVVAIPPILSPSSRTFIELSLVKKKHKQKIISNNALKGICLFEAYRKHSKVVFSLSLME
jgi:hypothetical protein